MTNPKFKGLDQSVAFDMRGHEDGDDRRSLILVAVEKKIVVAVGAN